MTDIFKQGKEVSVAPFYFKEVGDQVQGTYIGKRVGEKDNFGNDVIVYELKTEDGIKNVSFTTSKKINDDMNHVRFGQIVGFKFISKDKFMKNGRETEFKNIKPFADPKIVDQEWLDSHEGGKVNDSGIGMINTDNTANLDKFMEDLEGVDLTNPDHQLKKIADLAKSKLGVTDPTLTKEKVMEVTGLAFLPVNYAAIIQILDNTF